MSDDPPDQPKRWRGARRPPSRLATATTLFIVPSFAALVTPACSEDEPDETSRPWFDTLPEIDGHADRVVRLPPIQVPAMPAPAVDTTRASPAPEPGETASSGILERAPRDPAWPDSVGRLLPRRLDEPDRVTIENYFLYLPPGFDAEDRDWPVLVYLHGRSLRGDDLDLVTRYGIPSLLARGRQLPFIVFAPQLPDGQHWVDVDRAWELLDETVLDRYPVDEDRIYVTGFSMGGGGAWRFAVRHADRLAAAVPISASTPPPSEAWTEALSDLPMLVYHGDEDALAPYEPAVAMVEHLREAGQEIDLVTLEGEGHGIVQDVYRNPELYIWLLAHER